MSKTNGKAQLFEYVVLFNPEEREDEDKEPEAPEVIVDLQRVLAKSAEEVSIRAARSIPEEYMDRLDEVDIAIRPF